MLAIEIIIKIAWHAFYRKIFWDDSFLCCFKGLYTNKAKMNLIIKLQFIAPYASIREKPYTYTDSENVRWPKNCLLTDFLFFFFLVNVLCTQARRVGKKSSNCTLFCKLLFVKNTDYRWMQIVRYANNINDYCLINK